MNAKDKPRRRAPYHHGNLPEALVSAARGLIEREGTDAVTLRAVAKSVGVTHAAPYRHFKDKQALLDAVAATGRRELCTQLERELDADSKDAAGRCGRSYVRFAREHTALFRLMFAPREAPPDNDDILGCFVAATGDRACGVALWAMWHGLAMLVVNGLAAASDQIVGVAMDVSDILGESEPVSPRSDMQLRRGQGEASGGQPMSGATPTAGTGRDR